jgi:hypothetical protein
MLNGRLREIEPGGVQVADESALISSRLRDLGLVTGGTLEMRRKQDMADGKEIAMFIERPSAFHETVDAR